MLLLGLATAPAQAADPPRVPALSKVQSDYVLACGGCHGENGVSNARLVPDLAGVVGHFLSTQDGREYLVRLPNVATATLDDAALSDVLNFMVWTIGGRSAPEGAARFTAAEVSALRKRPLNDASLRKRREAIVDTLIATHGAPTALREYSTTNPGQITPLPN